MYICCLVIVIYVFVYIEYKLQCIQCFIYGNPEIEIIEFNNLDFLFIFVQLLNSIMYFFNVIIFDLDK